MAINKVKILEDIQKYIQKGQIDKAIGEFEYILKNDPKDYKLRQRLGDLYLRKTDKKNAINQYFLVADGYIRDGFAMKAIALYRQILRIEPSRIDIYEKLADLYQKQGLPAEAVAQLRTLAEIYERQKKLTEAMAAWEKIIAVDPDSLVYRGKLIEFYMKQGLPSRASEKLKQTIDYYKGKGRYEDVDKLISYFPSLVEEDKGLELQIAKSLIGSGKFKEALDRVEQILKANPKDAQAYCLKGDCYVRLGQAAMAKAAFELSLKINNSSLDARKGLLRVYAKEKDWVSLLLLLEEVYSMLMAQKNYDDLRAVLDTYFAYLPDDRKVLRFYVELFRVTGEAPLFLEKLKRLAQLNQEAGSEAEAEACYKDILTVDPGDAAATRFLESRRPKRPAAAPAPPPSPAAPQRAASGAEKDVEEIDALLKYGLVARAKAKLDELTLLYPESVALKQRWLAYFELTKDAQSYLTVLRDIVDACRRAGNAAMLRKYGDLLESAERTAAQASRQAEDVVDLVEEIEELEELEEELEPLDLLDIESIEPEVIEPEAAGLSMPAVDDMLREAEHLLNQGALEDAIALYGRILDVDPGNPVATSFIDQMESRKTRDVPTPVTGDEQRENFFDLSSVISELESEESAVEGPFKSEAEKIGFEEILQQFKNKVSREIDANDVDTHYNLGIAYKEMGLIDDAIDEFVLTSRFTHKAYDSFVMIGACLSERGDAKKALEFYRRALLLHDVPSIKRAGLMMEIGSVYEGGGEPGKALFCYQQAVAADAAMTFAQERQRNLLLSQPDLRPEDPGLPLQP